MPRTIAAEEALSGVPGVKVDNQANGERVHLSIRGQGILTEHGIRGVKILLDGIPLNDPTGFAPDFYDVDWATVNTIEVLRGPASALYGGSGSGGVISISTFDGTPRPVGGRARVDFGSNGFSKVLADVGGSQDSLDYRFSVSRTEGDGYRVHTAFKGTNLYGKLRFGGKLHLTATIAGTSFFNENAEGLNLEQVEEDPTQANPDALLFNEYQKTRRGTVGLTGRYDFSPTQGLDFMMYGRHTQYRESVPSSVIHRDFDGYGGSVQYSLETPLESVDNLFSAGIDVDWQDISEYRRPNIGEGVEDPEILSDQTINQRGIGLFILDNLDLGRGWHVVLGGRFDTIDNELNDRLAAGGLDRSGSADFSKSTWRAGVSWDRSPAAGFYAGWGQGFLPPATEELANNPDALGGFNENLEPATSHSVEVGARGRIGDRFLYDLALFRLITDGDFGRYRIPERPLETFYSNAGSSRRYGVESQLTWIPVGPLTVRLSYTYSHFRYREVSLGDLFLRDTFLPNSPKHIGVLAIDYAPLPALVFGATLDVESRAFIDAANSTWIDGYTLLNLRMGYRFQPGARTSVELTAALRNATDTTYIAFTEPDPDGNSYQPGPGREAFAGVLISF